MGFDLSLPGGLWVLSAAHCAPYRGSRKTLLGEYTVGKSRFGRPGWRKVMEVKMGDHVRGVVRGWDDGLGLEMAG